MEQFISLLQSGMQEILDHLHNQGTPTPTLLPMTPATPMSFADKSVFLKPRLSPPKLFKSDSEPCWAFLTQFEETALCMPLRLD